MIKKTIMSVLLMTICMQLVGCTYKCSICGKQKFGFGGSTIEYQGHQVTVCKSCKDTISGIVGNAIDYFK